MENMLSECKFLYSKGAAVAGTSDQDGAVVDMAQDQGYDGVCHIAILGDVTSGCVLALEGRGSASADGSSSAEEAGTDDVTAGASDSDSNLLVVVIHKPAYRYQFPRLQRDTQNAVLEGMITILYKGRECPVTQDAAHVIASKFAAVQ